MFIDDHISNVISKIDRRLKVVSIIDANTVKLCSFKWIKLFKYILVDGVKNRIVSINDVTSEVVFEDDISTGVKFEMPNVAFFIGSHMQTSSEWLLFSNDYEEKVPFIWLNFPAGITNVSQESELEDYHDIWRGVRLFFVGDADRSQWMARETIEKRTKIINLWTKAFVKAVKYPYEIDNNVTTRYYPIFGKESEKGAIEDIIEGNLSAVGIDFNLKVMQDLSCEDC